MDSGRPTSLPRLQTLDAIDRLDEQGIFDSLQRVESFELPADTFIRRGLVLGAFDSSDDLDFDDE